MPTDPVSRPMPTETTVLEVRDTGSGARMTSTGGPLRAVLQGSGPYGVRVALLPERALLLAGDDVGLRVLVGPGAHLDLREASGTVAYDMRGRSARWSLAVEVGEGGSVTYETLPWVSAAGSDVVRRFDLRLAPGAAATVRETLVLGRHGEPPGRLVSVTRVLRGSREVLAEELHAPDLAPYRVLDSVLHCPATPGPATPGPATPGPEGLPEPHGVTRLDTEAGDVLWRQLAAEAHVAAAALDQVWQAVTSLATSVPVVAAV